MLSDANSPVYKRILSEFSEALFGTAPPISNEFIADDGDYASELEDFNNGLLADSPAEGVVDVGANRESSPSTPPALPLEHVSISVTSNISHTIAGSSQVSNVVNASIVLPSEHEVEEPPPPKPRAVPRKKTSKSVKSTPDDNADNACAKNTRATRSKVAAADRPTRALRDRT